MHFTTNPFLKLHPNEAHTFFCAIHQALCVDGAFSCCVCTARISTCFPKRCELDCPFPLCPLPTSIFCLVVGLGGKQIGGWCHAPAHAFSYLIATRFAYWWRLHSQDACPHSIEESADEQAPAWRSAGAIRKEILLNLLRIQQRALGQEQQFAVLWKSCN